MGWQDRIVYHRDFAYNSRRSRMANGSIGDLPAATFAEYVDDSFFELRHGTGASQTSLEEREEKDQNVENALPTHALQLDLAHYSRRLHVRAKAKLQRDRLLSGPMIDIYVGESKRHWSLHRNLLCHHSALLEAELEGDADGSNRKDRLDLPEQDPAGFELLVKWLYQGKLDDVSDMADANQKYNYAVSCHKLYLLCDLFGMSQLKNVAMDQYRKGLNEAELVPDADEIDDIYRKSPTRSPFRQLMTRIAARQIMDPGSDRDVETYRKCFENNPDFAVDLVKAIKLGTGGMLFEDPTDEGNQCEYHDHEAGPNCNIKGKGKNRKAKKTLPPQIDPTFTKSILSTNSDQLSLLRHPSLNTPHPPPPRQARPQDGISAGPLRRRLTSPASSTVGTSKETAIATHPLNPKMVRDRERDRERLRRVTPPEKLRRHQESAPANGMETLESRLVPDEPLQSSENASHQPQHSTVVEGADKITGGTTNELQRKPSRKGLWDWARAGSGRLNIIGRLPHPEWKRPVTPNPTTNQTIEAAPENGTIFETQDDLSVPSATTKTLTDLSIDGTSENRTMPETRDDFSVPSAKNTQPDDEEQQGAIAATKIEGYGISATNIITSPSFSQTKRSSEELVAASATASTSANLLLKSENQIDGAASTSSAASKDSPPRTPHTPTPQQHRRGTINEVDGTPAQIVPNKDMSHTPEPEFENKPINSNATLKTRPHSSNTPSPHRIPRYKIALASNLLSPARTGTAST